ncbi:MAG TPA: hypothetical protein VGH27_26890 [Streptosporangiaceae bacterium]
MTESSAEAEGWYRDPYGLHEDRWFSAGNPTALVRDQGTEAQDDPPDHPPGGPPVPIPETAEFPEDDLRRADEAAGQILEGDLRRADEATANAEQAGSSSAFDTAFNAELPGFADGSTG